MNSELMVINQTLDIREGSRHHRQLFPRGGRGELYELLVMLQEGEPDFDPHRRSGNERLRVFVENHPNSYYANTYIQVRADAGGTAALEHQPHPDLRQEPAGLFFSLSELPTAGYGYGCGQRRPGEPMLRIS